MTQKGDAHKMADKKKQVKPVPKKSAKKTLKGGKKLGQAQLKVIY
jgi:hypothetical protein